MIYGFAYLGMVLATSTGWVGLDLQFLKKTEFIEKSLEELKNKIRPVYPYLFFFLFNMVKDKFLIK